MARRQIVRTTTKVIVAVGILMSMLLAGGAPGDFANSIPPTPTVSK
jgi:hypothetical protein